MLKYMQLTYQSLLGAFFLFATYRVPVDLHPVFLSAWADAAGGKWLAMVASALCSAVCFTAAMVCGVQFARSLRTLREQPLPDNE